ncbi:hypothetical protein H4Q26_004007 [Puccinia striiformis f. sp. tritici PST-130]|nr:hypothetical protein H4Q26_004007 [Puccinia striiformis f. sp. tritici PST-130]
METGRTIIDQKVDPTSRNVIDLEFSHLACYASGNWILGGKVFQDSQTFDYGLRLLTTCMETYKRTATGLGPEIFRFLGPNGENSGDKPSPQDVEFFKANGFYITNAAYHLRPEVIESAFYAWRLTGDVQYQEFVWQAFKSLQKYCKAVVSYSDIENVNSNSNPQPKDASESFLYAETFKYIYLTFSDPELLSLDQYIPKRIRSAISNHHPQLDLSLDKGPQNWIKARCWVRYNPTIVAQTAHALFIFGDFLASLIYAFTSLFFFIRRLS